MLTADVAMKVSLEWNNQDSSLLSGGLIPKGDLVRDQAGFFVPVGIDSQAGPTVS